MGARTGRQFLEGLRKAKAEVWLGGERVADVTAHPATRNAARSLRGCTTCSTTRRSGTR